MNFLNNVSLTRSLIYAVSILVTGITGAQSTNTVESQLLSCASGASDAVRLVCYDGLAGSLRASETAMKDGGKLLAGPAVESSTPPKSPASPTAPTATIGAERPRVDPSTGVPLPSRKEQPVARESETFDSGVAQKQSIRVMVDKTKRNARGDWYFYFDNGEVWKQIDTRNRRIPPLPVAATVSRGIFSSHKLHIDGEVWAMKIRRVK